MPFNGKKLSFHRKSLFFDDFLLISLFSSKNKQENKHYIHLLSLKLYKVLNFNILLQFIFFSQNCINYTLSSVFRIINILSKKDHLFLAQKKRNICHLTKKKLLFTEKVNFSMIFCLFHCFRRKNKQKTLNIMTINIFSSEKK